MITQVNLFMFVFWRKSTTSKNHFEMNWPLIETKLHQFNNFLLIVWYAKTWTMRWWVEGKRHRAPLSPGSYSPNIFVTGNSFFKWPKGTSTEMPASADISNWLVPSLGSRKLSIVTCMCSQHCLLPNMNKGGKGDRGQEELHRVFEIRYFGHQENVMIICVSKIIT